VVRGSASPAPGSKTVIRFTGPGTYTV
jgi:hypothetical protein